MTATTEVATQPLKDVLARELEARGWRCYREGQGKRAVPEWRHEDGERACSLNDAMLRQLIREVPKP